MTEDQIKFIEQEILQEIDNETKIENEIRAKSKDTAEKLMVSSKVYLEVNEKQYVLGYNIFERKGNKIILMFALDKILYEIAGNSYKPFKIEAEVNPEYTMQENLTAAIEAFIRHITGNIKPEMIEDEGSVFVKG